MSHIPARRITPVQKRNTPADESRRDFFAKVGVAAAAAAVGGMVIEAPAAAQERDAAANSSISRVQQSFEIRRNAALRERNIPSPPHPTNGDEARYPNKIGNYSKGLPHNAIGEVDAAAYQSLQQEVQAHSPIIMTFQEQSQVAFRNNVKGYVQGSVADLIKYEGVTK